MMRSGLMEACGHFLSSSEFRSQACEVLRHVAPAEWRRLQAYFDGGDGQ